MNSELAQTGTANILPDQAYLAGLREQIEAHEKKLKAALALTLDATGLDQAIVVRKAELQSLADAVDHLRKEQAEIVKMTTTEKARLEGAREATTAQEELLAKVTDKAAEAGGIASSKARELERQDATIRASLEDFERTNAVNKQTLADLENKIESKRGTLGDTLKETEGALAELGKARAELDGTRAATSAELAKLRSATAERESLDRQADTIVEEATKKASGIIAEAHEEIVGANARRDEILDSARAASEASRAEIAKAMEITERAEARKNAVEALKRNVIIELSKEMKNAELQKGNARIQDYLRSIQDA